MVLVIIFVFIAMVYFRGQASTTTTAQVEKAATPTAAPTSGQQGVTGNGDFASILALINEGLKTTESIIQTTTQKN